MSLLFLNMHVEMKLIVREIIEKHIMTSASRTSNFICCYGLLKLTCKTDSWTSSLSRHRLSLWPRVMDSDGDTRTKQDKNKQTNKTEEKWQNKQTNKQNLTKQETKTNACGTGRGRRRGEGERAKSQILPKMTHFCHDIFCSDEGRKWE